jgi:hypothetical protein
MLAQIAERRAGNQSEADYGVPKGLKLRDEIARYYRIAAALYEDFTASPNPSASATVDFAGAMLRDVLGFTDLEHHKTEQAVAFQGKNGRIPVVVVPPCDDLDRASIFLSAHGKRQSAASALQDWLSHSEQGLWGFCTNGAQLRLARDNASLTRPAFVEVNLREIFEGENFADFAAAWLLFHASRFGLPEAQSTDCHLERWREAGTKEGLVARDRLRDGVEAALLALGNGFVSHPDNRNLRTRLGNGELPLPHFFGQLLRLIYRMIFLFVAEDRKESGKSLLHPPDASAPACKLYAEGYSISALRDRAVRRTAWDRHYDRWEGLLITFRGLANGQPKLGLPALGGLFDNVIPDLNCARLSNRALMDAVYRLGWLKDGANLVPVNWRDMETEELGSVYESLLELTPILVDDGRGMAFAEGEETKGHQRKTTGSYYTPDSLVQTLLDSALDPVLDRIESEATDKAGGLLAAAVIDPACGSGHFLLAAARRIATRVARARTGGVASTADYRHALRDVVRSCIHGVDRNPMAVELTKVALWIETVEPGKPLGFLDANILCGDSLLGVFDLEVLRKGIPDAAYKPLSGDERDACRYFDRRNKSERDGQGELDFTGGRSSLPAAPPLAASLRAVRTLPEDSADQIAEKKRRLAAAKAERQLWNWHQAADLYVAAFLARKTSAPRSSGEATVPTTEHVWLALSGSQLYGPLVDSTRQLVDEARVFHWPTEFPDIVAKGGFDAVIGNPPWERIKIEEQEFFSSRDVEIALANAERRERMIAKLREAEPGTRQRSLFEEFERAKRNADALSVFIRESGRFPLTGRGDLNTYALFAELFRVIKCQQGSAGVIVPTGIATDLLTSAFFGDLVAKHELRILVDFENRDGLFSSVHRSFKFSILILGHGETAEFAFFLSQPSQLSEAERRFNLTPESIARINPNTHTAPVFRSRRDAEFTAGIYNRLEILLDESDGAKNSHGIRTTRMFDMNKQRGLFRSKEELGGAASGPAGSLVLGGSRYLPLVDGKSFDAFDHRLGIPVLSERGGKRSGRIIPVELSQHQDALFTVPRLLYIDESQVDLWAGKRLNRRWILALMNVTSATNHRTVISTVLPDVATDYSVRIVVSETLTAIHAAGLAALFNSLPFDYLARQKLQGLNMSDYITYQLAVPSKAALVNHLSDSVTLMR